MALFPYPNSGFWAPGSLDIHSQIIISSKNKVKVNHYWVSYGPLPGIY